jgi:hypothetical protein
VEQTRESAEGHELGIAEFVVRAKRARIRDLLSRPKGRRKFVAMLPHFRDWDQRSILPIEPRRHDPTSIQLALEARGTPELVYVISTDPDLDRRSIRLSEALSRIVAVAPGTVVSCIPGVLAYFEGEAPRGRSILHNDARRRGE